MDAQDGKEDVTKDEKTDEKQDEEDYGGSQDYLSLDYLEPPSDGNAATKALMESERHQEDDQDYGNAARSQDYGNAARRQEAEKAQQKRQHLQDGAAKTKTLAQQSDGAAKTKTLAQQSDDSSLDGQDVSDLAENGETADNAEDEVEAAEGEDTLSREEAESGEMPDYGS